LEPLVQFDNFCLVFVFKLPLQLLYYVPMSVLNDFSVSFVFSLLFSKDI
jgi:hypothetical protein